MVDELIEKSKNTPARHATSDIYGHYKAPPKKQNMNKKNEASRKTFSGGLIIVSMTQFTSLTDDKAFNLRI